MCIRARVSPSRRLQLSLFPNKCSDFSPQLKSNIRNCFLKILCGGWRKRVCLSLMYMRKATTETRPLGDLLLPRSLLITNTELVTSPTGLPRHPRPGQCAFAVWLMETTWHTDKLHPYLFYSHGVRPFFLPACKCCRVPTDSGASASEHSQ